MKVNINDSNELKVKWDYEFGRREIQSKYGKLKRIKAIIHCAIATKEDEYLVSGEAFLSETDNFNKDLGRKLSLKKALQQLFPNNKVARACFWEAYRLMTPIPRWETKTERTKRHSNSLKS
jgi:hypothetical protein